MLGWGRAGEAALRSGFDLLQAEKIVGGARRMGGGGEDRPLVVL